MRFKPLPVMTVLTLISLGILAWLGFWQYDRYREKMALPDIDRVAVETETISLTLRSDLPGMAQQLYGALDGEPVWKRYVAGTLLSGEVVLVLWDATGGPEPVALRLDEVEGEYSRPANILTRDGQKGTFAFEDRPENNQWYSFNPAGMARAMGLDPVPYRVVESLTLTVRNSEDLSQSRQTANPYAFETVRDPLPPERHFGYAITWWGLAFALIGVYGAFHHARGRLRFRQR